VIKKRPPRLQQIFQSYDPPLFFVTICTFHRRKIDRLDTMHEAFRKYALKGVEEFNVGVGCYVIMPDHMHFFVRGDNQFNLGKWINGLKRVISIALGATNNRPLWQPGFSIICYAMTKVTRGSGNTSDKIPFVPDLSIRRPNGDIRARSLRWIAHSAEARVSRAD
jgi:REP element-mobilizing transposase RayT